MLITILAILAALVPGALVSAAQAYTPPPNQLQFTLEGCRNDGGIVLPIDIGGTPRYACLDAAYTTGNLGKGWNELDLVPHRLITSNGGTSTSTFNVIIAADNVNDGEHRDDPRRRHQDAQTRSRLDRLGWTVRVLTKEMMRKVHEVVAILAEDP